MLTLSQLVVFTQADSRNFTTNYSVDLINSGKGEDSIDEYIQYSGVVLGGKEPRKSNILFYSEKAEVSALTKVSCSCPYFRYKLALSLYRMGATDVKVLRRDIPEKLQDSQKPGLCPHLLKFSEVLLSANSTETQRLEENSQRISVNARLRQLT